MTQKSPLAEMLELQDRMNSKIDQNWKQTKNPFLRAVAVEGVEGLESLGWKWWKKQVPDMQNVKMELVDIWHFILSQTIIYAGEKGENAERFLNSTYCKAGYVPDPFYPGAEYALVELTPQDRMELLFGFAALRAPLEYIVSIFRTIQSQDCKMSDEELYTGYLAKNVLNFFRQDHGYKEGWYHKIWFGQEDNVWLTQFADELSASNELNEKTLYSKLEAKYAEVVNDIEEDEEPETELDHDDEYANRLQGRNSDGTDIQEPREDQSEESMTELQCQHENSEDNAADDSSYALEP